MVTRLITTVLGCCLLNVSLAQTQRSGNDNARAMQQLQQLSSERSQLQVENDKLKKQVEELQAQVSKTTSAMGAFEQRAKRAEETVGRGAAVGQQNSEALEKTRTQLQELITKFKETTGTLKEVETDRDQVRAKLTAKERDFNTCVDRNAGLYFLNDEILQQMEGRGVWSAVKEKEPFTRISRTRLENLIDDYRYRADELRLTRQTAAK